MESVSAFAREAVNTAAARCGNGAEKPPSLDCRIGRIEETLDQLTQEVKKIEKRPGVPPDLV
jgi:hypothetical protein